MSEAKLAGKVALITGGSRGIGLETARLFVAERARVVLVGRDTAALEAARRTLGGDVLTVSADVANVDDIDRVMRDVQLWSGHLDILFANAAAPAIPSTSPDAAYITGAELAVDGGLEQV